jgi:sterol desaturase/sphingolipid hydroxylase (fatty acid hydroxylase superfamily)
MQALDSLNPLWLAYALHILRLCAWLVLLTVIFAPLERLFALHPEKIFRKAILTDLAYYFLTSLVPGVLLGLPLALVAWCVHAWIPLAFSDAVAALPLWLRIAASLLVGEIGFYWGHRWSHELPLLWRFHAVHHAAEHLDFLVSTRVHPVDMVFTRLCGMVPLYILGLASPLQTSGTLVPALILLIGTLWGFFIHANVRWRFGLLERLVATPAFHHWHHTNDGPAVINKNYAPMLPWIDQAFGTLYLPAHTPEHYGIDQPVSPVLFGQLVEPFFAWPKAAAPSPEPAAANPSPHALNPCREAPSSRPDLSLSVLSEGGAQTQIGNLVA